MTKVVLKVNCGDSNPPVFEEYFRSPVFAKYSSGF